MPKGEHFKKPNPRNTQISFKVNESESEKLQALAQQAGMSIPQWLRLQIEKGRTVIETVSSPSRPGDKKEQQQMSLF